MRKGSLIDIDKPDDTLDPDVPQIQSRRLLAPAQAAEILSLMVKECLFPLIIQELAEVEKVDVDVEMVEMEVEAKVEVDLLVGAVFRVSLGVRALLIQNGPLRILCMQCPRSLVKVLEMHLNSEILPPRRSLGPEFGTPTPSMGRIPISSEPSFSRASSISRIAPQHFSGITRRSII
jgi:hypothetical protein